ncbi:MAG: hypothetical protein WC836_24345 [Desulfobacula sp.]
MTFANEKTPEMRSQDWNFQPGQKKIKRSSFLAEQEEGSSEYSHSQDNPRIKKTTPEQYLAYQQAFDYFSRKLFESSLNLKILSEGEPIEVMTAPVRPMVQETEKPKKYSLKAQYQCTGCGARVWGKPGLEIICGCCGIFAGEGDENKIDREGLSNAGCKI